MGQYLLFSTIGTFPWTTTLTVAGFLGQAYGAVAAYVDPVSTAVLVMLAGACIYRVLTYKEECE